ncbi:MAG: RdgB/HAM1 family non-canonical purine NTP pyrophosphatase [Actinobacteria bacterium]|nr:RdgB/HAM1 family non-canonical purine NTP pyrophosphatase [Actinomycetota bacterium]
MPRLVLASKNPDKLKEMEAILGESGLAEELVFGLDWPAVEENGGTLEENALLKARAVVEATGLPTVADDTGLEVAALGGAPGVRTARYAGSMARYEDNVDKLLAELADVADRAARFRTVAALVFPDRSEVVAEGVVEGLIAESRRGLGGFGYDPVFEIDDRTLAEMSDEEKNQVSHRANALRALVETLGL